MSRGPQPRALCERFAIDHPVFAFSHSREVVAAVSRGGGFGVLGAAGFTPEQLEEDLAWIGGHAGGRPFGVDMLVAATYVGADEGGRSDAELLELIPTEHVAFVDALLAANDVPDLPGATAREEQGVLAWSLKGARPLIEIALAGGAALLVNALGPAPEYMVTAAHERGALAAGIVGKPEHVAAQVRAGVDLLVAQGSEAGGHTGEISTMVLTPQVVDAAGRLPVLAAGGIASGRQMAAALALGADGVWCGSVWVTTEEAETPPVTRDKYLAASSSDTRRSRAATGKPARQLRSAWTDAWEAPDAPEPLPLPLQWLLYGPVKARVNRAADRSEGARRLASGFVGQVVGQLAEVRGAEATLREMVAECDRVLDELTTPSEPSRAKAASPGRTEENA